MLNSQLSLLSLRLQVQPVYQAFKSSSILFQSSYWALAGSRFKLNLSCWRFSPSHFQILAPSLAVAKMMKLLRLFSSRNQLSNRDALSLHAFTHSTSFSTARQNFSAKGSISDKVYAPFSIFKGKAAVSLTPILPTFTKLESGSLVVDRRGAVMLKFTPAIGERKYDWEKTQVFALSATEVGSLISLGPKDSCELLHDPSMKSSNAGQVRKSLSIKPHADGGGYFISLNVVNNLLKTRESLSVPITTAEFAVMKTACSFALPHIMGWDRLTNKMQRGVEGRESRVEPQLLDEWDR